MSFRVPVGYNPAELPGQIVDEGLMGRIVDPITGESIFNPDTDPREFGIDPITGEEYPVVDVGWSPSAWSAFASGLYNAQFDAGPPEGLGSQIEEVYNEIPYWRYVQDDSGHIRASWVADASTPSGRAIQWDITNSVSGDEAYFEQIAPVEPRAWRTAAPVLKQEAGDGYGFVRTQYLTRDGTETGSESIADEGDTDMWGTTTLLTRPIAVPDDARFQRVRIGCRQIASNPTGTKKLYEVYAGRPRIVHATVAFSGVTLNPGGSQAIHAVSGNIIGTPDNAVNRYFTPYPGWVRSISVHGHTVPTAGTADFRVRNEDEPATIGPTARLGFGYSLYGIGTGEYDASTNKFLRQETLRITATATSNFSNPGLDTLIHVTFALLDTDA